MEELLSPTNRFKQKPKGLASGWSQLGVGNEQFYSDVNGQPSAVAADRLADLGVKGKIGIGNPGGINSTTGWFGKDGYLANGAQVVGALSGLAGAYTGYKNYQLAKDQFDAEQKYAAANLYNQGTLVNNQIENAAKVGQSLAGDTMTADQKAAQLTGLASKYVKTAV